MKKLIVFLFLLTLVVISGCAADQGGGNAPENPAGHQAGCH